MRGFRQRIRLDGLEYELEADELVHIVLSLLSGASSRGRVKKSPLFPDVPLYDDVDLLPGNGMRLFSRVMTRIERWVYTEKPHQFFVRTDSPRRARIFLWMARRRPLASLAYIVCPIGRTIYFFRDPTAKPGLRIIGDSGAPESMSLEAGVS
jgi:hypothetical protein